MQLIENTVGSIIFTLTMNSYDGQVIEKVSENEPFDFVFGVGAMLESFENELKGLKEGDEFKFILSKDKAYGTYSPEMIIDLEKQLLIDQIEDPEMIEEEIQIDNFIPMLDPDGNMLNGKLIEIGDEMVKLDFNHPLADMDLYFVGKVLALRPASPAEIHDGKVLNATRWEEAGPDDELGCQG
jgi:FKBP-type peptidyl-prolyl cis-trans isomerase SlyD